MKILFISLLLLLSSWDSVAQLVRRKDYDAAFAIQMGGETGVLTTIQQPRLSLSPTAGFKVTIPFTRKWFLGTEVNYSRLKFGTSKEMEIDFNLQQWSIPLYLKYMLNNNKASVLLGCYGAYVFNGKLTVVDLASDEPRKVDLSGALEKWHAGITVGYEHRIVKHLNIQCRVDVGVKEMAIKQPWNDRLLPVKASITLSYDIFRIGDCECD